MITENDDSMVTKSDTQMVTKGESPEIYCSIERIKFQSSMTLASQKRRSKIVTKGASQFVQQSVTKKTGVNPSSNTNIVAQKFQSRFGHKYGHRAIFGSKTAMKSVLKSENNKNFLEQKSH